MAGTATIGMRTRFRTGRDGAPPARRTSIIMALHRPTSGPAAEPAVADAPPLPPPGRPDPDRLALFLDLDGTLAPLAATPGAVGPDPRRTGLLRALAARLDGRVAILSGRPLADIDRIVEDAIAAGAGVHGLERRDADRRTVESPPHQALPVARGELERFAAGRPGVLVEDKGAALALHYRQAPDAGPDARRLAAVVAEREGLALQPGDCVIELRTPGADKGSALAAFMAEAPFRGCLPVMVGDDLTDEHAFAAALALGGHGVLVGPARASRATARLADVEAVLAWLETLAEAPR